MIVVYLKVKFNSYFQICLLLDFFSSFLYKFFKKKTPHVQLMKGKENNIIQCLSFHNKNLISIVYSFYKVSTNIN